MIPVVVGEQRKAEAKCAIKRAPGTPFPCSWSPENNSKTLALHRLAVGVEIRGWAQGIRSPATRPGKVWTRGVRKCNFRLCNRRLVRKCCHRPMSSYRPEGLQIKLGPLWAIRFIVRCHPTDQKILSSNPLLSALVV